MMLDLSVFQDSYFELKMFDGEVIQLKKPSQELVIRLMSYEQEMKKQKNNPIGLVTTLVDLLHTILNNNKNEREFSKEFIKENFDLTVSMALLKGYMDFVQEVNSNPNS